MGKNRNKNKINKRRERFALNPDKGLKCNPALFPIYPVQQAAAFDPAK